MPQTNNPILIVGAGPVGLTAALELKRRGATPMIIDNDGVPTPESRALAIHARTLDIFEKSGISERLIAAGNKINHILMRKNNKTKVHLNLKQDLPHRYNFILALPQSRTEEILIEALGEQGIDVNWYTSLETLKKTSSNFEGTLLNSNEKTEQQISPQIVIGADGAHSTVRKALNIPFDGQSIDDEWSLADVELSNWPFPYDHAVVNFTPKGPIGFFPLGPGYGRLVSSQPDVLNNVPEGAKITKTIWHSTFKISYRQVATYQQGNAFLAGDAAHIHSPAGGRGMNLGIEDAATLAYLLANDRQNEYTHLRHPIGKRVLKMTEQQTKQITAPGIMFDFMLSFIAPLIMSVPSWRRQGLARLTGLDTPKPEWLH